MSAKNGTATAAVKAISPEELAARITSKPEPTPGAHESKFTLNLRSSGEISLTIRTNNEEELEALIAKWEPLVIVYPDPSEGSGEKRYFPADNCPHCSNKLVRRKGRNGKFLGCSNYPECTFTAPL